MKVARQMAKRRQTRWVGVSVIVHADILILVSLWRFGRKKKAGGNIGGDPRGGGRLQLLTTTTRECNRGEHLNMAARTTMAERGHIQP